MYLVRTDGNGDVLGTTQIPAFSYNEDFIVYPNPAYESINWKIPEKPETRVFTIYPKFVKRTYTIF